MKRFGIPLSYLTKMSTYSNITVHGLSGVKVSAPNCEDVLEEHVTNFIDVVRRAKVKVVGVDLRQIQSNGEAIKLVVMFSDFFSLVFNVDHSHKIPDAFIDFVNDDSICFVAATDAAKKLILSHHYYTDGYKFHQKVDNSFSIPCVLVGDLAVMVLKKAGLNKLSVAEIAGLIEVSYDQKLSNSASDSIHLDLVNPLVFTTGKIESVISDACACYQIGYKLLSSL